MKTSVIFLGHMVSCDRISTNAEKIKVIREWQKLGTVSKLR